MFSGIPQDWRVPIAWAVLWLVPAIVYVAFPPLSGLRTTDERAARVMLLVWLLIFGAGATALLLRSIAAWWILVLFELLGVVLWASHVGRDGLGIRSVVSGVLTFASAALLISAPMRRFVRLRGRFAA